MFHKLPERFTKAQLLEQSVVPRTLFGGVESTLESVYSSDSQLLLLSRLSVNGAYYGRHIQQEKQLLGYQLYCF